MKKRLFASILAVALLLGLVSPVSTNATGTGETIATDVTTGSYVDKTADPNASYEYIITGNDGSREAFTVGPKPMENTGNKINEATGITYVKTPHGQIKAGNYIIVGAHQNDRGWIVKPEVNAPWEKTYSADFIANSAIKDTVQPGTKDKETAFTNLEWTITPLETAGKYTIRTKDNKYMDITSGNSDRAGAVTVATNVVNLKIVNGNGDFPKSICIGEDGQGYLNKRGDTYVGTWTQPDGGSSFYLMKRQDVKEKTLDLSGLKALIDQSRHYTQANYTVESWKTLTDAIAAANVEAAKHNQPITGDAQAALTKADEVYTILWNAILNLVPAVKYNPDGTVADAAVAVPSIIWQRTLEYNNQERGDLVVDLQHLNSNELNKIQWDWSAVANLTTNPTMTVWDYNTENQYTSRTQNQPTDVVAATWSKHSTNDDWTKSTVRKFSGEFKWPAGYDLADTAKFVSVNDANYKPIYDYIQGKKETDPELYNRYKDATVMPINDDMYVVMYKDQDKITAQADFMQHLVFWTGTSGKGIWSHAGIGGDDWARKTPPVFGTRYAVPAYHEHRPNLRDIKENATVDRMTDTTIAKLKHADGWYTMANTSAVMSTLNSLYKTGIQAGEKMHVDIYCFNNSSTGGMDQLELKFVKRKATSAKLQVNYFLDSVNQAGWLGSTAQTDVAIGEQITLQNGTGVNELNHMRAKAKEKAGAQFEVSDGVQRGNIPYTVVAGEINHINVVYTTKTQKTSYYTYDFGVKNEYTHTLDTTNTVKSVSLKTDDAGLKLETTNKSGSNQCKLTYKASDALRQQATGILTVTYTTNGQDTHTFNETVCIYPASNVLYEEDFLTPVTGTKWQLTGTTSVTGNVTDNKGTAYGYTDKYAVENPDDKAYTATVQLAKKDPTTGKVDTSVAKTGYMETKFGGTGFDLIGTCGPDTGALLVRVSDTNGKLVKMYVIDTKYDDVTYGTIKHVPLLHCEDLVNDTYNVTIQGMYINRGSKGGASTMSMNRADQSDRMNEGSDPVSDIYDALYEMGLKESDIDNVEFVSVEDNLAATTYAVDGADRAAAPTTPESMKLELDGFRVYGTTDNKQYAADNEQHLIYKNVLDSLNANITAYLEKVPTTTNPNGYTKVEYQKNGGPQYEAYLNKDHSLALKGDTANAICQVALRSVTGKPIEVSLNGTLVTVSSPVEMYYAVTPVEGIVTIQINNKTTTTNPLLAVGNLKLQKNTNVVALAEADYPVVYSLLAREAVKPEEPEKVFTPEQFNLKMDSKKIGKKTKVTITVESSSDVEYITVNGKKVKAENDTTTIKGFFQNLFDKLTGKVENPNVRKFVFTKRYSTKKLNGLTHEVISYNKENIASKPVIAEEVSK